MYLELDLQLLVVLKYYYSILHSFHSCSLDRMGYQYLVVVVS